MVALVGVAGAAVVAVLAVGWVLVRELARDGYGRRAPLPPGRVDPSRDWSADLPSRPYQES